MKRTSLKAGSQPKAPAVPTTGSQPIGQGPAGTVSVPGGQFSDHHTDPWVAPTRKASEVQVQEQAPPKKGTTKNVTKKVARPPISDDIRKLPEAESAENKLREVLSSLDSFSYNKVMGRQGIQMECRMMLAQTRNFKDLTPSNLQDALEMLAANRSRVAELKLLLLTYQTEIAVVETAIKSWLWELPIAQPYVTKTTVGTHLLNRVLPTLNRASKTVGLCIESVDLVLWHHKDFMSNLQERQRLFYSG